MILTLKLKQKKSQALLDGGTLEDREAGLKMMEQAVEALTSPIIGWTGWADSITFEQKARIKVERLKQIAEAKGEKIEMATDYEAMVYIMTASLSQPLSNSFQRIYFLLFKKFFPENSDFIPEYEAKLEGYDQTELDRLKRWLYKHRK